jgi:hypothetical protein
VHGPRRQAQHGSLAIPFAVDPEGHNFSVVVVTSDYGWLAG